MSIETPRVLKNMNLFVDGRGMPGASMKSSCPSSL